MRTSRLRLAAVIAALVAGIIAAPALAGPAYADHVCQAGTSWDNIIQACR